MLAHLRRYARWLHTQWPAGTVEPLPEVREDGSTHVPGLFVAGDLTGVPLLKLAADGGARAVRAIAAELEAEGAGSGADAVDLAIVGGGVAGMAAALEARALGLEFSLLEASEPFATIVNFPRGKPIFTYPTAMTPAGELALTADVREGLLAELRAQTVAQGIEPTIARVERVARRAGAFDVVVAGRPAPLRARRVLVAIGRAGDHRRLGVPGEDLDKVSNRLHDPRDFAGQRVLVVGGGDSAIEGAVALAEAGAEVTLAYRKGELVRPKPGNLERLAQARADPEVALSVELATTVASVEPGHVTLLDGEGEARRLENDAVFTLIGREAPLGLLRRSGVRIAGERGLADWLAFAAFVVLVATVYLWKDKVIVAADAFPADAAARLASLGEGWAAAVADRASLIGTVAVSAQSRSFSYTLLYSAVMAIFGWRRIRRRRTPYVTAQTAALVAVQVFPLFLLPEVILPYLGYNGLLAGGWLGQAADALFPLYVESDAVWPAWGHPRAYWHAYGLVLAWPLFVYNVFTPQPMTAWLVIAGVQTFVLIPLLVRRWGKGAYCGWICSCGGLAETLGDAHRHKMPRGPGWNRLNLVGQGILAAAFLLLGLRVLGWALGPASWPARVFPALLQGALPGGGTSPLAYKWLVDVALGGVVGVGCYFWFSGRVWCRFACPLAALMHVYARFSRFRILADKQRCISCNVCTSVCHQGIDVMAFASRGLPMADPQCVRCSACVAACPTGVLEFGRVDAAGAPAARDRLSASRVRAVEGRRLPVAG